MHGGGPSRSGSGPGTQDGGEDGSGLGHTGGITPDGRDKPFGLTAVPEEVVPPLDAETQDDDAEDAANGTQPDAGMGGEAALESRPGSAAGDAGAQSADVPMGDMWGETCAYGDEIDDDGMKENSSAQYAMDETCVHD